MTVSSLIIGTRGSRMALTQADMVTAGLVTANPGLACETKVIKTSGDWKPVDGERRLSEQEGGKGLFIKEIEQEILNGAVHLGVHSLKDVPSFLPGGLAVDIVLKRPDPRDMFIGRPGHDLFTLPAGSVVGTASLRRQAVLMKLRPDLNVVPLRGNVPTRLEKIRAGMVDAAILSYSGIERLGMSLLAEHDLVGMPIPVDIMLPACGQGIVCLETRLTDNATREICQKINDSETAWCAAAERHVLQILDGSCHTPIGAYATLQGARMCVRAMVAMPDGSDTYAAERTDTVQSFEDVINLAGIVGMDVRTHAPDGVLPVYATGT
jgi:hydroxymethylbilane synthase